MPLIRLTEDDVNKLAELLVRAVALNAPIHRGKDGKGPQHCPVVIWEDAVSLDTDCLEQHNPNATSIN